MSVSPLLKVAATPDIAVTVIVIVLLVNGCPTKERPYHINSQNIFA